MPSVALKRRFAVFHSFSLNNVYRTVCTEEGHTVWIRGSSGISTAAGKLKLEGTGTIHGTLRAVEEGQLSVAEGVVAENLVMNGQKAYLDMRQDTLNLTLGAGKSVALGQSYIPDSA